MDDYFERLKEQKQASFKIASDRLKSRMRQRHTELQTAKPLPRYLLRALESADLGRIEACIDKAMGEGWTEEEMTLSLDVIKAHVKSIVQR
jgi:hypothetical protein